MISWYAAFTQPHGEAKASDHLERQGYSVYLPCYRRWVRHARQRKLVLRPLFPRYLFVGLDREAQRWRPIRSTVGVLGLVTSGDEPVAVPPEVIDALREREREGGFDVLSSAQSLRNGDAVRVIDGPFQDLVGRLLGVADHERVFVLLDVLGRSVRASVAVLAVEAA
jgi:transcriptional antiterminator RfaH